MTSAWARVAGYWAPGAAGAATAALLTRHHPAPAARPVTPLRPEASPPTPQPATGGIRRRARAAARPIVPAARPEEGHSHVARFGELAPAAQAVRSGAGEANRRAIRSLDGIRPASARSPPGPGVTASAARTGIRRGPRPSPRPLTHSAAAWQSRPLTNQETR